VTLLPIDDQSQVREAGPVSLAIRTLLMLVLLLGCANVSTLLMASQMARRSELATRAALGASRARLVRQLMTEGVLLGAAGGALGGLMAFWAGRLLLSLIHVGPTIDIAADGRTLMFIGLASLLSGVVSSLAPALRASRTDLRSWLGHDAAHTSGSGRFGSVVIGGQAALCMAVVACAVLLAQSARKAQDVTIGFDAASVLTTGLGGAVRSPEISRSDASLALEAVRALPAVAASAVGRGSSAGGSSSSLRVQSPAGPYRMYVQQTSEDYLRVLGVDVIRGRYFDRVEFEQSAPVVVIGEGVARATWGDGDPVGDDAGRLHSSLTGHRIIGVARDVVAHDIREAGGRASALYRPLALEDYPYAQLFVRVRADEPAAARTLQMAVMSRLPDLRPRFTSLAAGFERQAQVLGLPARVAGVSAVVVLFLAALGLGGVAATLVRHRRRELAIRIALGASHGQVTRLVVGHILRPVALGVLTGAGLATLLGTAMRGVLIGVSAVDPVSMLLGALILFASGAVAIAGPARVAARVAPGQLLKDA
jgi:putative ABC transport system permease protein